MFDDIRLLKIEQILKINTRDKKNCITKIADINSNGILILPLVCQGLSVKVEEGDEISVTYWTKNNLFNFETTVERVVERPISSILLRFPQDVLKVQRRKYFRMEISNLPVHYASTKQMGKFIEGHLFDISGGGLAFLARDEELEEGEAIRLKIVLPGSQFNSDGKIIRKSLKEASRRNLYEFSVEFKNIDEVNRDKIIKFIFDKQAEERRLIRKSN